jgi:hypothetical protein
LTVEELQVVISVKMEKIDAKINNLIKKCDNLGANATKAGKGTDKLSNACAKLKDRAEAGSAGTHKLSGALKALKTGAAVAAITAVTKAVKKLTDSYAETQAAQVGLESILAAQGKDVSQAKAWLQEYTKDGLIPLADAYTAYKNLSSAGYADDQTQSILQNLKDSAAFARQGSLTMGEAVRGATEGIKQENSVLVDNAGVTKNLSVIWEEYAASIGKGVGSLTAAEKRLATVEGLMRETAFQTGDAARYASTFAGAQAALKAQTKQLSSALGSIFAPALQAALPYLTALAEKMTVLATRAGQVMAVLFGIKPTPIKQLATSTQTASAGLEKATKKAKELKGQLLGIDELNVIEKADTSDSGGSDTAGNTGGMSVGSPINSALSNADNVIDPRITARAEEIREKLKPIVTIMDRIKDTCLVVYDVVIKPFVDAIAPKVRQQIEKITYKWGELVKRIENSKIYQDFIEIVKKLVPPIEKWCELLASITASLGGMAYELFLNSVEKKFKDLEDVIGLVSALLQGDFADAWEHFKNLVWDNKIDRAKEELRILGDTFSEVKAAIKDWVDYWRDKISEFVSTWKVKISEWWNNDVKPWFTSEKWEWVRFNAGVAIGNAVNKVREVWKTKIPEWWNNDVKPWFTVEKWKEVYDNIVTGIRNKLDEFKRVWGDKIAGWWNFSVKPWFTVEKWKELGTNMKNGIVSGVKSAVSSIVDVLNGIIAKFESLVNGVIGGVNKIIEGYNSVTLGQPKALLPQWTAPKLPKLALGGVIEPNDPFVGVLGDNRREREIVSPESTLYQQTYKAVRDAGGSDYDTVYRAVRDAIDDSKISDLSVELDGKAVGRAIAEPVRQELIRSGKPLGIR